jgi:hypothetical protein
MRNHHRVPNRGGDGFSCFHLWWVRGRAACSIAHPIFSQSTFCNTSCSVGVRLSFNNVFRKCAISSGKFASRKAFIVVSNNLLRSKCFQDDYAA